MPKSFKKIINNGNSYWASKSIVSLLATLGTKFLKAIMFLSNRVAYPSATEEWYFNQLVAIGGIGEHGFKNICNKKVKYWKNHNSQLLKNLIFSLF